MYTKKEIFESFLVSIKNIFLKFILISIANPFAIGILQLVASEAIDFFKDLITHSDFNIKLSIFLISMLIAMLVNIFLLSPFYFLWLYFQLNVFNCSKNKISADKFLQIKLGIIEVSICIYNIAAILLSCSIPLMRMSTVDKVIPVLSTAETISVYLNLFFCFKVIIDTYLITRCKYLENCNKRIKII